jgi:acetylornithine deacetylase/succinyl-diaminopimelate desuccinylase-like protein
MRLHRRLACFALSMLLAASLCFGCARHGERAGAAVVRRDRSGDSLDAAGLVAELSAPSFEGRQAGAEGGRKAGEWIAGKLASLGLDPRTIEFRERVPVLIREPELTAEVLGGEKRSFVFRRDFREVARGAWIGQKAEGPIAIAESPRSPFPRGAIVATNGKDYDSAAGERYRDAGAAGLLLVLDAPLIEQRPTYPGQAPGELAVPKAGFAVMAISPEVFGWLERAAARGGRVSLVNPLGFADGTCRDYLAAWNGDGGGFEPTFLLLAHYDHVGVDRDGPFPGALDNASGVAFLLSLAEDFVRDGVRADLAFLFTDAEEVNLSGAVAFLRAAPFPVAPLRVLNFDMLGSAAELPVSLYSAGDRGSLELATEIEKSLSKAGIAARSEHPVYNVDSGPFAGAAAAAVTLCEYEEKVHHTHRDGPDGVSGLELAALEDAMYAFILERLSPR